MSLPTDPTSPSADVTEPRLRLAVLGTLALVAIGGIVDLYSDGPEAWFSPHAAVEAALIVISATLGILLWRAWRQTAAALGSARQSLTERSAERDAWRTRAEEAVTGFAKAIDEQFARWGLTPAEREVALLILEGHGHKEIAWRTERSERTVRQHAVAVYQKSGCRGRSELAAFFLGDLMAPHSVRNGTSTSIPSRA